VRFPIVRDQDRKTYEAWKIYVVPSNFLIDTTGIIRYGSVGAVEWDSPEVIKTVEAMQSETTPR